MLDNVALQFDPTSQLILNIILALLMFGVSFNLKVQDFLRVMKKPIAPVIGLICQFLLLPALTYALTVVLNVPASMALGMILVSSCPGGNFSNVITFLARGNVATSVTMTAISSSAAVIMTPLNFSFYAWLNPQTRAILTDVEMSSMDIFGLVILVLGIPLVLGMWVGRRFPEFAIKSTIPVRYSSLIIFISFVVIAFVKNVDLFMLHWSSFVGYVAAHNSLALGLGFAAATVFKLNSADRRAITFEVGIQNSGLGLILLFTFMPELGGAVIIAAFWGVWHLLSGLGLALFWSKRTMAKDK